MGKRKKFSFSHDHSKIEQIDEYYNDSEDSLNLYYSCNLLGEAIPVKFIGYSRQEVGTELKERKKILDRMCSLEILAAIEARLRIDYIVRSQNKLKDDFSKKLRKIYDRKENKASLVEDILYTWKAAKPEHKTRCDDLIKALNYRNWLAHGRYWLPKQHVHVSKYDYLSIYTLATDILSNLELVEA